MVQTRPRLSRRTLVFGLPLVPVLVPYALSLAAASFLYVSMADLIPGLHRTQPESNPVRQVVLVGLGLLTMVLMGEVTGGR